MFESSLLSNGSRAPRRSISLRAALALHAAAIATVLGASLWRSEDLAGLSPPIALVGGVVEEIRVLRAPSRLLEEAARRALAKWRHRPATSAAEPCARTGASPWISACASAAAPEPGSSCYHRGG